MENEQTKDTLSFEDVKGFIENNLENEDIKNFLNNFNPLSKFEGKGYKEINQLLESDETLKPIKSYRDLFFEEGMKKFKGEKLPEIIKSESERYFNEKYKSLNPPENPEEVMRREFEERIAKLEKERRQDALKAYGFKLTKDENILPFIMGNSEEEIENRYNVLSDIIKKREAAIAQKIRDDFKKQGQREINTPLDSNTKINIDTEIKKAMDTGNIARSIALKREKYKQQFSKE